MLTQDGQDMKERHDRIHMATFDKDKAIFDQFNDGNKEVIYEFLTALKSHIHEKDNTHSSTSF